MITSDPWVLGHIKGVQPNFILLPTQVAVPRPIKFSLSELAIVEKEILSLLAKGVISRSYHEHGEIISNIFIRPKKDGKYRVILNLKSLNQNCEYSHFKMESFTDAVYMVRENAWFASLDIKDAYYTLPLSITSRKFFKFYFRDNLYQFNALVQGYSEAPRIFTKCMRPILVALRKLGINILMYLDDSFITADNYTECSSSVSLAANTL